MIVYKIIMSSIIAGNVSLNCQYCESMLCIGNYISCAIYVSLDTMDEAVHGDRIGNVSDKSKADYIYWKCKQEYNYVLYFLETKRTPCIRITNEAIVQVLGY